MKLALKAVPYRALQKTTTVAISAVFLTSIGGGIQFGPPQFAVVVAGSFLAMVVYELAYYQRFEYELTEDTLDIRSGVFNRRSDCRLSTSKPPVAARRRPPSSM